MLYGIRKFIIDMFHQIRLMFHHTHCESNCGNEINCECDNDGVSISSSSSDSTKALH